MTWVPRWRNGRPAEEPPAPDLLGESEQRERRADRIAAAELGLAAPALRFGAERPDYGPDPVVFGDVPRVWDGWLG